MSAGIGNDGGAGLFERWPQKTIQLAGGVLLLGFIGLAAPLGAQPRITEDGLLRIASWSLLDAVGAGVIARKKPVERSWRNTFGSERRIASRPAIAGEKLGADVVLLQGVKSIQEVRQIFPARDWKLILSRQVLRQNRGRINNDTVLSGNRTTTAVAVRYQRGLRVTGFEHLLDLGVIPDSKGARPEPATTAKKPSRTGPQPAALAGMALRLIYLGTTFWVVSVALPNDCRIDPGKCRSADQLVKWAEDKRTKGLAVVFGGQLHAELRKAGPSSACADQEIVADRILAAEVGAEAIAGCMAFVELKTP